MIKRTLLVLGIAVVALAATGCWDKAKCMREYDLVDPCTIDDCMGEYDLVDSTGVPPVPGPPGPIITLKPPTSGATTVEWKVDSTSPTSSGTSIYPACALRYDFIGESVLTFDYFDPGATVGQAAEHISVTGTNHRIDIRLIGHKIDWVITERKANPELCVGPAEEYPFAADKLPLEFFDLANAVIREEKLNRPLAGFELQVKLKASQAP